MRASLLRTIPWVAAGAALLAFVAPGCGIGGDDLFGGTGTSSGAAASGSGASSTGADSGSGGDSSGPGPGPGTQSSGPGPGPGAGGQGGDPSSGPGGAPNGPASSSAEASTAMSSSSGPPPDPPVQCGGVDCVLGQESCCWDANQWNGAPQGECVTGGIFTDNCNTDYVFIEAGAETRIECQLPEHCPGQLCCGHRNVYGQGSDAFVYYDITICQNTCDNDDRILCNPMAPDCPGGSSCKTSTLLPPDYYVCSFN